MIRNTKPSCLLNKCLTCLYPCVGTTRYGPVDYSGVLYIQGRDATDYVGVVFGYQSNRKFYVVMWRRENSNFQELNDRAGIKGVQLKVRPLLSNSVVRHLTIHQLEVNNGKLTRVASL